MVDEDPGGVEVEAVESVVDAEDRARQEADARTRALIRASAEHARLGRPLAHLSPGQLKALVESVEEDLRQARDKRRMGDDRRPGIERRRTRGNTRS